MHAAFTIHILNDPVKAKPKLTEAKICFKVKDGMSELKNNRKLTGFAA